MKNKLAKIITAVVAVVLAGSLIAAPAFADDNFCNPGMGEAARAAAGCNDANSDLTVIILNIVRNVVFFLGIVAVIVIVVGGVLYMTSAGDASKVKKARDTILYAVIGLAICALSFAIVNFSISVVEGDLQTEQQGSQQVQLPSGSNGPAAP